MKRAFTLLEIIVVIVILGILATLAVTQYAKMVEKSRGAEARTILGNIRTNQAGVKQQSGACSSTLGDVGIGLDFPSSCSSTHYFTYDSAGVSGTSPVHRMVRSPRVAERGAIPAGRLESMSK